MILGVSDMKAGSCASKGCPAQRAAGAVGWGHSVHCRASERGGQSSSRTPLSPEAGHTRS